MKGFILSLTFPQGLDQVHILFYLEDDYCRRLNRHNVSIILLVSLSIPRLPINLWMNEAFYRAIPFPYGGGLTLVTPKLLDSASHTLAPLFGK